MRIIDMRELSLPLEGAVANSVVSFAGHRVSLVALTTDVIRNGHPLVGLAFNSIGRHSQGGLLRDRMFPRLAQAGPADLVGSDGLIDPARVLTQLLRGEKPGGHGDRATAAAVVELACWDLLAKFHDEPAALTIARAHGREPVREGVPVYAAGGYYRDGAGPGELAAEVQGYVDAGYDAVKIKVGGMPLGDDLERVEAALGVLGSGARLAVDANGRFTAAEAAEYARALAPYDLRWFEEPVDPLDLSGLAEVIGGAPTTIATGENVFSTPDVRNLLDFGGLRPGRDVLQMDAGLSYGLTGFVEMLDLMEERGFDRSVAFPHGGHLINLHIVTGLGLGGCEAYPGVFAPVGGYHAGTGIADGRIHLSDEPGFGLEAKSELGPAIAELTGATR